MTKAGERLQKEAYIFYVVFRTEGHMRNGEYFKKLISRWMVHLSSKPSASSFSRKSKANLENNEKLSLSKSTPAYSLRPIPSMWQNPVVATPEITDNNIILLRDSDSSSFLDARLVVKPLKQWGMEQVIYTNTARNKTCDTR